MDDDPHTRKRSCHPHILHDIPHILPTYKAVRIAIGQELCAGGTGYSGLGTRDSGLGNIALKLMSWRAERERVCVCGSVGVCVRERERLSERERERERKRDEVCERESV